MFKEFRRLQEQIKQYTTLSNSLDANTLIPDFQTFLFSNTTGSRIVVASIEQIQDYIRKNAISKTEKYWSELQQTYQTNFIIFQQITSLIDQFGSLDQIRTLCSQLDGENIKMKFIEICELSSYNNNPYKKATFKTEIPNDNFFEVFRNYVPCNSIDKPISIRNQYIKLPSMNIDRLIHFTNQHQTYDGAYIQHTTIQELLPIADHIYHIEIQLRNDQHSYVFHEIVLKIFRNWVETAQSYTNELIETKLQDFNSDNKQLIIQQIYQTMFSELINTQSTVYETLSFCHNSKFQSINNFNSYADRFFDRQVIFFKIQQQIHIIESCAMRYDFGEQFKQNLCYGLLHRQLGDLFYEYICQFLQHLPFVEDQTPIFDYYALIGKVVGVLLTHPITIILKFQDYSFFSNYLQLTLSKLINQQEQ